MGDAAKIARRVYKNPPIVEAICSFSFSPDSAWNATVPGRFYEQIRSDYPEEPEERPVFEANIEAGFAEKATQINVGSAASRISFRNGSQVVAIAPRTLSAHSLAPYEGWDSLRSRALAALAAYRKVTGLAPVTAIGLRYVNRVLIPERSFNLADYFTVTQGLPDPGFPGSISSFFDRMEVSYSDAPAKIAFTWASDGQVADLSAFIMDFDLSRQGEISDTELPGHLDDLRERERAAFESLLTDRLRGEFDANRELF